MSELSPPQDPVAWARLADTRAHAEGLRSIKKEAFESASGVKIHQFLLLRTLCPADRRFPELDPSMYLDDQHITKAKEILDNSRTWSEYRNSLPHRASKLPREAAGSFADVYYHQQQIAGSKTWTRAGKKALGKLKNSTPAITRSQRQPNAPEPGNGGSPESKSTPDPDSSPEPVSLEASNARYKANMSAVTKKNARTECWSSIFL